MGRGFESHPVAVHRWPVAQLVEQRNSTTVSSNSSCPTKSQSFPFGELHEDDTSQACRAMSRIDRNVGAEKGRTYGIATTAFLLPVLKLDRGWLYPARADWGVEPRHSLNRSHKSWVDLKQATLHFIYLWGSPSGEMAIVWVDATKNFGASFQVHRFGLKEELGRGPGNVGGAWKFSQRFQVLFIDINGKVCELREKAQRRFDSGRIGNFWHDGVRGKPTNTAGGSVQFR